MSVRSAEWPGPRERMRHDLVTVIDTLFQPTESMLWLEQAAEKLESKDQVAVVEITKHREAQPDVQSKTGRKRLRRELFEKQDGLCVYCDSPMSLSALDGRMASFDHVRPESIGGEFGERNLVLACWQCNRLKGCMTPCQMRRLADRIEQFQAEQTRKSDLRKDGE